MVRKSGKFFGADLSVVAEFFFDRKKVIDAMDRKVAKAMNFIGGTLRKTAKRSVRKSTKNKPHGVEGGPVRTQTGIYPKTILYEYDPRKKTVICGPKKLSITDAVQPVNRSSVPELLEKGGRAIATRSTYMFVKSQGRNRRGQFTKKKQRLIRIPPGPREYKPRPTMQLAWRKTVTNSKLKQAFGVIGFRTR